METISPLRWVNSSENGSNVPSDLDPTAELGARYLLFWDGFALPIIGLLGIIGNILSIIVLSRKSMRRSAINIMLIGLTGADLLFVVSMIFFRSVGQQYGKWGLSPDGEGLLNSETWIWWFNAIWYPISYTACTGSHLFTVFITIERYIAVCHPLKAVYICTESRAKCILSMTVLGSIILSLPTFFDLLYPEGPVKNWYDLWYTAIWTLGALNLTPFVVLIVLNIAIYREIRKSVRIQGTMRVKSGKPSTSQEDANETKSLSCLLFAIILTFLICKTPQIVTDLLYFVWDKGNSYFVQVYLSPRHFLDTLNSCVNFVFYCVFGKKFRQELAKLFKSWGSRNGGDGPKNGESTGSAATSGSIISICMSDVCSHKT